MVKDSALLRGDKFEPCGNILRRNSAKVYPLTAGQNRAGKLVNLSRGKDKNNMRRRLLKGYEQGIKGLDGEHMHLIDNIDPVFCHSGSKGRFLTKCSDILNASIACGIDFNDIKDGAVVNSTANFTFTTGVPVDGREAIDSLCKYLGAGGLARAS